MSRRRKRKCSVEDCENKAIRSISIEEAANALSSAGLSYSLSRRRRVYLCRDHYKAIKKQLKKQREKERLRFTGGGPF